MRLRLCDACHRQLNVTGLGPDIVLTCLCGAEVQVGAAPELVVEALRCGLCGAPVGPDDRACGHCTAALSEADRVATLLCPACHTRLDDDAVHCKACGVALRPQAITPLRAGAACPACKGRLRIRLVDDYDLVECMTCAGVFVGAATLTLLTDRARASTAPTGAGAGKPAPEPPRGYLPCVTCGELMHRRQHRVEGRPTGIVIDVCKDHGVWFDRDELAAALAATRDATRDAPVGPKARLPRPFGATQRAAARRRRGYAAGSSSGWDTLADFFELVLWTDLFD